MKRVLKLLLIALMLLSLCSCSSSDTITPEKAYCPLQIGVVMDANGFDDNSYNEVVWNGVKTYANSVNLSTSCFKYFESSTEEDYIPFLRTFADSLDIVFATSPLMAEATETVAIEYPRVTFVIIDTVVEGKNIVSLNYDEKYQTLLAGMLSAKLNEELTDNKVLYYGDDLMYAAIFEQGALLENENSLVELSVNEAHNYEGVNIVYPTKDISDELLVEYQVINVGINENDDMITKNIGNDITNLLLAKSRNQLTSGAYASKNFTVKGYEDLSVKAKAIISEEGFEFAETPRFMITLEENPDESTEDSTQEIETEIQE